MIRVRFDAGPWGPATEVEVPSGARLVDVCDEAKAPVPFSCRDARCGTCLVEVTAGSELLAPPSAEEADTLQSVDATAAQRLACHARLAAGAGILRLRAAKIG